MEGLDLSSLSQNMVDAAALPSMKADPTPEKVVIPGQNNIQAPIVVDGGLPGNEIAPLVLDGGTPPAPEDVASTLESLDNIISLGNEADIDEEDGEDKNKSKTSDAVYPALAAFLREKGIIEGEDPIEDEEAFVSAISKTIEAGKYSNLSPDQLLYLKALEAGIPNEEAKVVVTNMNSMAKVDAKFLTENPTLAEEFIVEDLKAQGWDATRITKQLERLRKTDEVLSEGLTAKDNIIARNTAALEDRRKEIIDEEQARSKKAVEQLIKLKDSVFTMDKALSVVKVDEQLKNQIYEAMTKPVAYTTDNQPLNILTKDRSDNPVDFENRMYTAYVLTNGFRDISRLQRRAETNAAKKLKDVVSGLNLNMNSVGTSMQDSHEDGVKVPDIVSV